MSGDARPLRERLLTWATEIEDYCEAYTAHAGIVSVIQELRAEADVLAELKAEREAVPAAPPLNEVAAPHIRARIQRCIERLEAAKTHDIDALAKEAAALLRGMDAHICNLEAALSRDPSPPQEGAK